MNPNDLIFQATVAVMLLAVVAIGCVAAWRRWGRYRARRQLIRSFEAVSAAVLRDVLIPDGSGGQLHIDFLLLTGRGLLVVDYRDVEGVVFGGEHMREWAVMDGSRRSTFLNPLEALYDRIAAVRLLAGEVPVDGRIIFTSRSKFPKGRPPRVMRNTRRRRPTHRIRPNATARPGSSSPRRRNRAHSHAARGVAGRDGRRSPLRRRPSLSPHSRRAGTHSGRAHSRAAPGRR